MAAGVLALVSLAAIVMLYLAACHSAEGYYISPEESMEEEDKDFKFSFANTDEFDVSSSSSSSSVNTQFDEVLPQVGNYESTADFYSRNQNPSSSSSSSRPMGGAGGSSYYGVYSGYNSQEAYSHNSLKKPESLSLASAAAAWSAAHATFYGGANAEGTMGNK
jgi:hypothetical protein